MKITSFLKSISPNFIKGKINSFHAKKELESLNSISSLPFDASKLKSKFEVSLDEIFTSKDINSFWEESRKEIEIFNIPDFTGGVNPGDRRSLYYLISYFKPSSVLEVGTHIGASTVHIATALSKNKEVFDVNGKLVSTDIADVNSLDEKPWLNFGTKRSPKQMIDKLNLQDTVKFLHQDSLQFLEKSSQKFDFIFLDGDHTAQTVYQEIHLALKSLNENGVILLHDYFPNGKPLWSDNFVVPGPQIAVERIQNEGATITILPLANLPWPTKLNSNITSLALVLKNS